MNKTCKTMRMEFRLTEKEYAHLRDLSEKSGLPASALIRKLIMEQELHPHPPEEISELLHHLTAMGNNINQIAKVANSSKFIRQEDIEKIQEMQSKFWKAIKYHYM